MVELTLDFDTMHCFIMGLKEGKCIEIYWFEWLQWT